MNKHLEEKFIEIIRKLTARVSVLEEMQRNESAFGAITNSQLHYLETVQLLESPTFSEIAEHLKISKPSVTVAINKLIQQGFLRKVQSERDLRSFHIELTDMGIEVNSLHDSLHKKIAVTLTANLTETEAAILLSLLDKSMQQHH